MYKLIIHEGAQDDLAQLDGTDPDAADEIWALIDAIEYDQALLDTLTIEEYGAYESQPYNVRMWQEMQRANRNIWRIKIWSSDAIRYRIIYAFEAKKQRYHILAIAPREFNYDAKHPISLRIIRDYNRLLA